MNSSSKIFEFYQEYAQAIAFPASPEKLYGSIRSFLDHPAKRVRPVLCIMGNELFGEIHADAYYVANAIELFHNFTLVHDDIMDHATLRRGKPALHIRYGDNTAILAGDRLLIQSYIELNKVSVTYREEIVQHFSKMACEICDGQQMDLDFEDHSIDAVSYEEYLEMITLKTSVLLGTAARIGAIIGSADHRQQENMYEFGKNVGIAFQIQDDLLDVFGNTAKMGKQVGGDIRENKKTALLIKAFELADAAQKKQLKTAIALPPEDRVTTVTALYSALKVDDWANEAITRYTEIAFDNLADISVPLNRKEKLSELARSLLVRQS